MSTDQPMTARRLAELLGGRLEGEDAPVRRLAAPGRHDGESVVVVQDERQAGEMGPPAPALLVVPEAFPNQAAPGARLRVPDTRAALARLSGLFDDRPLPSPGLHPTAVVAADATIGTGVRVGPQAVVGSGTSIGSGTTVGAGTVVGPGVTIGRNCLLHPRVTILDGVRLGDRVIVHPGAVIGSDGFGYAITSRGALKIHHLGGVVIGDDVEIGANTCVDRATLGDTVIGDRTKIDNQCQIAHNVRIGNDCLIAGQSGIAGSTTIGHRVVMAGGAGVADHLSVGDGAVIGARAGVTKDVAAGERVLGFPAIPYRRFVRQSYLLGRLERIWESVRSRADGETL